MNPQITNQESSTKNSNPTQESSKTQTTAQKHKKIEGSQISKALWNLDSEGRVVSKTNLANKIEEITLDRDLTLDISFENLKKIDVEIRKEIPLPKNLEIEQAEFNVLKDGGTTFVKITYYDTKTSELLTLASDFPNSLAKQKDPDRRKVSSSASRMSSTKIANSWEYGRRVALHLLKLDPTRTAVEQERIVTNDTITWKFTEEVNSKKHEVTFNLKTGAATFENREISLKTPLLNKPNSQEFKAALIKHLSAENLLSLSQFSQKGEDGEFLLNDSRVASIKKQIAKSFNIPENYSLKIDTVGNGSAWHEFNGDTYLSGNINSEKLTQPVHFIFNRDKGELLIDTLESLKTVKPISRASVPKVLEEFQK